MPCISITVPCDAHDATAARCHGQSTGLSAFCAGARAACLATDSPLDCPSFKGDGSYFFLAGDLATTAGRTYPSLAVSHSMSDFTVAGVEPMLSAMR
ncbi:hypothetical protein G1C95_2169 [Bifidobacterium sp. DSM 109957]|uniref:Uncharacterized protein n=1 Tax=Bifidobacterium oedipodis TaxID=2675322 RepID=A0A7Y0HTD6_9BIFI|nr:hypothetical protein [Bifidobacterium sp. DSM 109957]